MIEIVAGCGLYSDGKRRRTYTPADGPFAIDPAVEAKWVKEGVAHYVNAVAEDVAAPEDEIDDDYSTWSAAGLKAELESRGIEYPARANKAALVELLEADDLPPVFDGEV